MKSENLVVLKAALTATKGHTIFKAHHFYRCIQMSKTDYVIHGELFSAVEYKSLFETANNRILRDFKGLEILGQDNTPLSKSLFTKLADIHTYGRGRNALKVWYFRNTRERIYGFYPNQGTKAENQKECYQWYLELVGGEMDSLDQHDVMFGNCGIPIGYGNLRIS